MANEFTTFGVTYRMHLLPERKFLREHLYELPEEAKIMRPNTESRLRDIEARLDYDLDTSS